MKPSRQDAIESAARCAIVQMEQSVRLVNDNDFNLALRDLRSAFNLKVRKPKLHVLVIDNDSGLTSSLHRTRAGATAALYVYVGENWGEMDTDDPMPTDMQEAIDAYFGRDDSDDRALIEAVTLED